MFTSLYHESIDWNHPDHVAANEEPFPRAPPAGFPLQTETSRCMPDR